MKFNTRIASFKHRVALCSGHDVATVSGEMVLARVGVLHSWAQIIPSKESTFAPDGIAVMGGDKRTHYIVTRFRPDFDISSAAWLYEERRLSGGRWFKVIGYEDYNEDGRYFVFACKIVERGELMNGPAQPPVAKPDLNIVRPLPEGVKL